MVVELNGKNFRQEVLYAEQPVLVDFSAEWCKPCKAVTSLVKEVAEELSDSVKVCTVDADGALDILSKYKIFSVPTLMVFENGNPVAKNAGRISKMEIKQLLSC